ncbi:hypothetical protein BN128_4351 [Cronobacter sakazakii 696]|nr:hypothetical protein BN128_4351 [Cronobacter sakazakii 696]
MVENIRDVLRLVWRARFNHAAFGLDIDRFAILRHAFGALLKHAKFFNGQMNLLRLDLFNFAAHRGGIDVQMAQNIRRRADANRAAGQFKMVVATGDFDAEAAFKLFDVVIKGSTEAKQTGIVCRFQRKFTSFDIQTCPLGHSGPVKVSKKCLLIFSGPERNYSRRGKKAQATTRIFG